MAKAKAKPPKTEAADGTTPPTKPLYVCEKCGQTYVRQSAFAKHRCKPSKRLDLQPKVKPSYVCQHCGKTFVRERAFINHKCSAMIRSELQHSPIGYAAAGYYRTWMMKHYKKNVSPDAFVNSGMFRTFMNFAEFVNKVSLPMVDKFIWFAVTKKYSPILWTNDEVYTQYLEFIDRSIDPMEGVQLAVETLLSLAEAYEVDVSDIFEFVTPSQVIHLLRLRHLTPWLVLRSTKFKRFFQKVMTHEQRIILEALITPDYWFERFSAQPDVVSAIDRIVAELGL